MTRPRLSPATRKAIASTAKLVREDDALSAYWCERYKANEDPIAGQMLLTAFTPTVTRVVRRAVRYDSRDATDFIQEGLLGVLHGARTYEREKGKAGPHVWSWIRNYVSRYARSRTEVVRLPVQWYQKKTDGTRRASTWHPNTRLFSELDVATDGRMTAFEDTLVDDEADTEHNFTDAEREAACKKLVPEMLASLRAPIFRKILERRFYDGHTLADIGASYNLSRERIRQMERDAIKHLQDRSHAFDFDTFDEWLGRCLTRYFEPASPLLDKAGRRWGSDEEPIADSQ